MRPARPRRRGITLIETSVACVVATLLVYLVAMSWNSFTRGAKLMVARAELVREADLAVARLADSLRDGDAPELVAPNTLAIGPDVFAAAGHVLTCNGEPLAWHVAHVDLDVAAGARTIRLRLQMPDVYEDRQGTVMLRRDFFLTVVAP